MTLSTSANTVRIAVTALGVPFPFPIPFFKNEHLVVSVLSGGALSVLTLGSDYSVTGAGSDSGGTVSVTTGIAVGDTLIIERKVPEVQQTDLRNQGEYLAETVEDALDYLTMISQQLSSSIGRLLQFPTIDPESIKTVLPPMAARASKVLAFDLSGDPVVSNLTLSQLEEQPALALASAQAAADSAAAADSSEAVAVAAAEAAAESAASVDGRAGRFFGELVMLPNRQSSPNGVVKADGQLINNALALYPEVVANLQSGTPSVPVTTPALWLSDPTKRLCWAYDSVNNQIRVPDWNGKSAGSLGPAFFRGDGSLGFAHGTQRQDQTQPFVFGSSTYPNLKVPVTVNNAKPSAFVADAVWNTAGVSDGSASSTANQSIATMVPAAYSNYGAPRFGAETFPNHGVGVWGVVLFGAISNPGAADAAALATSYANQQGQISTLDAATGFAYVYFNGGSEGSPVNVAINSRYEVANPFGDHPVICVPQFLYNGEWETCTPAEFGTTTASYGVLAAGRRDKIVARTGSAGLLTNTPTGQLITTPTYPASNQTALPCRAQVWRLKG